MRNLWRQFGGWYDGTRHLKLGAGRAAGRVVAALAGGGESLAERALEGRGRRLRWRATWTRWRPWRRRLEDARAPAPR